MVRSKCKNLKRQKANNLYMEGVKQGINDIYETKKYERDNYLFEMILDKLKELKEGKNE